jgi:hypothetical protein
MRSTPRRTTEAVPPSLRSWHVPDRTVRAEDPPSVCAETGIPSPVSAAAISVTLRPAARSSSTAERMANL